eukprot:6006284-Pyramimonas_sp.AAC.1
MRGAATSCNGPHVRSLRNSEVLYRRRILPARGELAVRRIRRLQGMLVHRRARGQTIAAIFGRMQKDRPTLLPGGQLN